MSLKIQKHLCELGFECIPDMLFDNICLFVILKIDKKDIKLVLFNEEPFTAMPRFFLLDPKRYGKLAHVMLSKVKGIILGSICVNDRDSVSVNFARPELAVEESLKRHHALLESAITNEEWNERELLREFYSNWLQICDLYEKQLLVSCADTSLQRLNVYSPIVDVKYGINSHYLVEPKDKTLSAISELRYSAKNTKRAFAGKAIVVPIATLKPAPNLDESLEEWYLQTIQELPEVTKISLQHFGQWRDKNYWVIFTAVTIADDRTWFAVKLTSTVKKTLPTTLDKFNGWKIKALSVRMFSHENVVSRGGGNPSLKGKRVALVGAGSVGCEIAHKLSAAGVSDLTIFDSDVYTMDNLHRHILPQSFVEYSKSAALTLMLHNQFIWSDATYSLKELLNIHENNNYLSNYDLIIIAIGRPTHELLFKQYLLDHEIDIPVINCWLEGFGVGGHAVLDIPESKGCLLCSYVCQESGRRGLNSNLNFIEQNQNITKNIAGCGEQFITYGSVCSAQTALMATDLAIKFLEEKIIDSCKVSWKGDDFDANEEKVSLTHRYYKFDSSLNRLPLLDRDCDVCNG